MDFPASLGYWKENLKSNKRKKIWSVRDSVGYSYLLATDVNWYWELNKQYIREIRDSIKRRELRPKLEF